jgi:N-acetylglucosaminyldiphosphoundecaprenol N-acetyl-beta-D-mannosaminyltransferase
MDVATMDDSVRFIIERIEKGQFTQHVVVNVAKIINMRKDQFLGNSVRSCELINIDGMGVVFGGRMLGYKITERVSGVDLFDRLLQKCAEHRFPIYLLGATTDVVLEVRKRIENDYKDLNVVGHHHGFFWGNEAEVVEDIKTSGAKLLFVAITSPKKEIFINHWKDHLGVDFVMGVGGTFDVVAGVVKRAPQWMQKSGFEWLYRIIQEPSRMWKRYAITNTIYIWLITKEIFLRKSTRED